MKFLELTLPTPQENLALDEALLEMAEEATEPLELLRLWESPEVAVVIGRSSHMEQEVNVSYCREAGIPMLRRCSGGAAVVLGPGCLMYAVVLSCELRPHLRMVDHAHRFVLNGVMQALRQLDLPVEFREPCDLTVHDRKISGNSMRCKRRSLLYHGTILYSLSGELIEQCLRTPPRQPEYRRGRSHAEFVMNIPLRPVDVRNAMVAEWRAEESLEVWPRELTRRLVTERYSAHEWNFRL